MKSNLLEWYKTSRKFGMGARETESGNHIGKLCAKKHTALASVSITDYPRTNTIIPLNTSEIQLTIVDNPDRLLDKLSREDSEGRLVLPYWMYLWESAIGLAQHLSDLGDILDKHRVLEIGCGFGLTGIVACMAGAEVIWTDFEHGALQFARHNAQQNGIDAADFVLMDWNAPCFRGKFDVILAADVIYEEQHWLPIARLLQNLMKTDAIALFSEPNRKKADRFFTNIQKYGWTFEKTTRTVSDNQKQTLVNIYKVERAK